MQEYVATAWKVVSGAFTLPLLGGSTLPQLTAEQIIATANELLQLIFSTIPLHNGSVSDQDPLAWHILVDGPTIS